MRPVVALRVVSLRSERSYRESYTHSIYHVNLVLCVSIIAALTHVVGAMHSTLHAASARSAIVRLSSSTQVQCASAAAARGLVMQPRRAEACGSAPGCSPRCMAQNARSAHPLQCRRHSRVVAAAGTADGGNGNGHSEVRPGTKGGGQGGGGHGHLVLHSSITRVDILHNWIGPHSPTGAVFA